MTVGCSVAGGAVGFGVGGSRYSATGAAEHFAAGGSILGGFCTIPSQSSSCSPSPSHMGSVVPMCTSLQLV